MNALDNITMPTNRNDIGRAIYLAMYAHQGGKWEANDTKEVWYEIADRFLAILQKDDKPL